MKRWAVLAGLIGAALAPSPASAEVLTCGQHVRHDTILSADLSCAAGPALVVDRNGVDLDLGGRHVTVTSGPGVIVPASHTRLHDGYIGTLVASGNPPDAAVRVAGWWNRVERIMPIDSGNTGILVHDGGGNTVSQISPHIEGAFGSKPLVSLIRERGDRVTGLRTPAPVTLASTSNTRVTDGVLGSLTLDAQSHGNVVARNWLPETYLDPSVRVAVGGPRNRLTGNRIHSGVTRGILVTGPGNVLTRNRVEGIDGFHIGHQAPAVDAIGIDVTAPHNVLRRNVARYDDRLGIRAVAHTVDGGGNVAAGNTDARQCVGVRCRVPAQPAALTCGAQVAHDVVLRADLYCDFEADTQPITVTADNVTIDLAGHFVVSGKNGTFALGGHHGVTIRDGEVDSENHAITGSSAHGGRFEYLSGNGETGAVLLQGGAGNRFTHTSFQGVRGAGGITLVNEQNDRITDLYGEQVRLNGGAGSRVTHSVLGGVFTSADSTAVTGNWLHDQLEVGGLLSLTGTNDRAARNQLLASVDHPPVIVQGTANTIVANEVRGGSPGVDAPGALNVLTAGNRVGRNLVLTTQDEFGTHPGLGIFAVPGTIDLGGNRAALNSDPRQCVGVVCGTYP